MHGQRKRRKETIYENQSLLICNVDNFVLLNYIYVMLQLFHLYFQLFFIYLLRNGVHFYWKTLKFMMHFLPVLFQALVPLNEKEIYENATRIILQTALQKPLPYKQQPGYHRYHHITQSGVTYSNDKQCQYLELQPKFNGSFSSSHHQLHFP